MNVAPSEKYEIRAATSAHLDAICELARYLDSVNLPHDPDAVRRLLQVSEDSFAGKLQDPTRREYVFALWDCELDRALGTSMVIGQLGRRDAPYIYFDVRQEEKYSATLDRHFVHTLLATRYSYDGPTEIGGLVVDPAYRGRPERLGSMVSLVRFLFIAMQRDDFQDELLAELLPPLEAGGRSILWEAVGRRFTGLSYREADRLSRSNKEFIRGLFPDEIYATLLSDQAQAVIGAVGPQTRGVERLLRSQGFEYARRVDPFDGGPHFVAPTDAVAAVASSVEHPVSVAAAAQLGPRALVARRWPAPPYFRAVLGAVADGCVALTQAQTDTLGVRSGDPIWTLRLP